MFQKVILLLTVFMSLTMANHLKNETSPYLLQHKDNPVDWYPWGEAAFAKAKKEHKLIFLSIGYSTCHWCHVMARESFEHKDVAKVLNKDYVSIKVDREQYPQIDSFYQKVYRVMNNRAGGWPLTIILTPDMKPFFAATYIPRDGGYGSSGLIDILKKIAHLDRKKLHKQGEQVLKVVKNIEHLVPQKASLEHNIASKTLKQFEQNYDSVYKGFGRGPKFPQFTSLVLLLKIYQINGNKKALSMAVDTLRAMAKSGMFDQIEGAFYRYSVDRKWAIPHFEKMLYTNAEALEAYSLAYKITKEPLFKEVIDKTISQIDERFLEGGVYKSASNADSKNGLGEEEEGYYFLFDYAKALEYLEKNGISKAGAKKALHYLGISEDGNFNGEYSNPKIAGAKAPKDTKKVIALLKKMRHAKKYPFIDSKINTAWNALYIKGKLMAATIDKKYLKSALSSLDTLLKLMYKNGELYHQTIPGRVPVQKGVLQDYAFLANALFKAYQITLEQRYFDLYEKLVKDSIKLFYKNGRWLESHGGFKSYAEIEGGSYASDLGVEFINLTLYATAKGDYKVLTIVKKSMSYYVKDINAYPSYFPSVTLASLLLKYEPLFIKSNRKNLQLFKSESFRYPFVYKEVTKSNQYLACKLSSCFSYATDIRKIRKDINALLK